MGILFLLLGFLIIINQRYTIKKVGNERNIEEKAVNKESDLNKYELSLSIFSMILGIFCIINYTIY